MIFGPEGVMKMVSNKTIRELDNLPLNVLKGMPTSAGVGRVELSWQQILTRQC